MYPVIDAQSVHLSASTNLDTLKAYQFDNKEGNNIG